MIQLLRPLLACRKRSPNLIQVSVHFETSDNFSIAGTPADLGCGNTPHPVLRGKFSPVFLQLIARCFGALEPLDRPVGEIAEGLLLSRFNTLAAHAHAYADPANERERAIRAALDDFATSLGSLVDCYPGVRAINANRLALALQAEQALQAEAELRKISAVARANPAVGPSAIPAFDAGRDEVDDLSAKSWDGS